MLEQKQKFGHRGGRMPRNNSGRNRIQFYVSILAEDEGLDGHSSVVSMHSECVMLDSNSGHKSGTVGLVMKPVHHKK